MLDSDRSFLAGFDFGARQVRIHCQRRNYEALKLTLQSLNRMSAHPWRSGYIAAIRSAWGH